MDVDDLSPAQRRIAEQLRVLAPPPSPQARARLLAAVRAVPSPSRPGRGRSLVSGWRRISLVTAAALVGVAGVSAGALRLSAHALPGSPAYSLRLAGERLRLTVAGPADRERLRITFARDRVEEARAATGGDRAVVERLLRDSAAYRSDAGRELHDSGVDAATQGDVQREIGAVRGEEHAIEAQLGIPDSAAGQQDPGTPQDTGGSSGAPSPSPAVNPGGEDGSQSNEGTSASPPPSSPPAGTSDPDSPSAGLP